MTKHGIRLAPIDDTMLITYVLEGGAARPRHGRAVDAPLGYTPIAYDEVTGTGKSRGHLRPVPLDKALRLCRRGRRRDAAPASAAEAAPGARAHATLYETIERPLVPVVAAMEAAGIKVDRQDPAGAVRRFRRPHGARSSARSRTSPGTEFNVGSPKQLGEVLFDEDGAARRQEGQDRRLRHRRRHPGDAGADLGHPLPQKVLDWRQLAKLKSTYTDTLAERDRPDDGPGAHLLRAGR